VNAEPATAAFTAERPRLLGLAYRMLGTLADAEDVVQEAWLRWNSVDPGTVESPAAWLTTVTTRLSLDRLRAVRRSRVDYHGPWLPEPIVTSEAAAPDGAAELADSLTLGFLVLMDRLSPLERAAFILHDLFGLNHDELSRTLGRSAPACRQLVSRARHRLRDARPPVPTEDKLRAAGALLHAVVLGDLDGILAALAPDVVLVADGGGQRRTAARPVVGRHRVARFLSNVAHRFAGRTSVQLATVNGEPGVVVCLDGELDQVLGFESDGVVVTGIKIIRNPDKLARVGVPTSIT
jgi:RNA polymerase sigma factor (sigma-70 family)